MNIDEKNGYELVVEIFEIFYRSYTLYQDFEVKHTKSYGPMFKNFLDWGLSKRTFTTQFLCRYYHFQFFYWEEKNHNFNNSMPAGWIVGPKARARWEAYGNKNDGWLTREIKGKLKLKLGRYLSANAPKQQPYPLHEEPLKKRFPDDPYTQYVYCLQVTTLFHPNSPACDACPMREECEDELKTKFPKQYNRRINESSAR